MKERERRCIASLARRMRADVSVGGEIEENKDNNVVLELVVFGVWGFGVRQIRSMLCLRHS